MTDIENVFKDELEIINKGGYGFMGKEAKDLTRDELLIYVKQAVDQMIQYQTQLQNIKKKILNG